MSHPQYSDEHWMQRCFDLARLGLGSVSPNPPVGAVLVHQNEILSEGYHHQFGGPHAEVETIWAVPAEKRHLIPESILYVTLEPCCITGKTPPCTDLIIRERIKDVRISAVDPNPRVAGNGIAQLKANGISVKQDILKEAGEHLIRAFRINILEQRPYIVLKWAQSKYGISGVPGKQVWFSHPHTQTFSHRLRAECDCILVGARTVKTDDPSLTTREYPGRSPIRVVYDPRTSLSPDYKVFNDDDVSVYYFSEKPNDHLVLPHIVHFILNEETSHADQLLKRLFKQNIGSILVEGGAFLHHLFTDENKWDEAWVTQTKNEINEGIRAPNLTGRLIEKFTIGEDTIVGIKRNPE